DEAYASVENDAREQGIKKTYPSEVSDEEALNATGFNSIVDDELVEIVSDFFSVKDGELIVHTEAFNLAYQHAQELLRRWASQAVRSENGVYKPPSPET